jgi:hypothetical protein
MADEKRVVVNFRMAPSLKVRAEKLAKLDRRTLSAWLELAVEHAVEAAEAAVEKPKRR